MMMDRHSWHISYHLEAIGLIKFRILVWRWHFVNLERGPSNCSIYDKPLAILFSVSQILKLYGPRNHGIEIGLLSLAIIPSDPVGKFVISIATSLGSVRLQVLVPKGVTFLPGWEVVFNWTLNNDCHLITVGSSCQETNRKKQKKWVTILNNLASELEVNEKQGLLLHNRGREE